MPLELNVPAWSTLTLALTQDLTRPDDARAELLVVDAGDYAERALWFFAEDKDISWPTPQYDAVVQPTADGNRVRVTARTILRDLTLFPDRLHPAATVDEALVTLLPGESANFTVQAPTPLVPSDLTRRPVLRCGNDLNGERVTA
jgi:beta-mannosidase